MSRPRDRAAARAERRPNRELAQLAVRPGEEQVRDVHAPDEEHEDDAALQQVERGLDGLDALRLDPGHRDPVPGAVEEPLEHGFRRIVEPLLEARYLGQGLALGDARPEARIERQRARIPHLRDNLVGLP